MMKSQPKLSPLVLTTLLTILPTLNFAQSPQGGECRNDVGKIPTEVVDRPSASGVQQILNIASAPQNLAVAPVKTTAVTQVVDGNVVVVTSAEQRQKHNTYAKDFATYFRDLELNDTTKQDVKKGIRAIQSKVLSVDPQFASNTLNQTITQLSRTDIGRQSADDLLKLAEVMDEVNPTILYEAAPTSAVGKLFVGLRDMLPGQSVVRKKILKFFRKFSSVNGVIDTTTGKLERAFNLEEKEIQDVYKPDADMLRAKSLELIDSYAYLEEIHTEMLQVYNSLDPQSEKALFIRSEVLVALADFQKTIAEMIGIMQQAEMAQLTLIETGESAVRRGREEVAKAKIGIRSGIVIAAAIGRQQAMIRGTVALRDKSIEIQNKNAQNLLNHVLMVNGFEIDQSQTQALENNYVVYQKIRDERKQAQEQRYQVVSSALPRLKEVRKKMEALIADQRKGMVVRGQLQSATGGVQ